MLDPAMSRLEAKHRIADLRFMWKLAERDDFTHKQIAEMRGCSREYITQTVSKIRHSKDMQDLIKIERVKEIG